MNFVENNGKKVAAILCVASAFPVVATIYAQETAEGWHGNTYVNQDKKIAKGWTEIDGKSYYFDQNGKLDSKKSYNASAATVSTTLKDDVKASVSKSAKASVKEEDNSPVVETQQVSVNNSDVQAVNEVSDSAATAQADTTTTETPVDAAAPAEENTLEVTNVNQPAQEAAEQAPVEAPAAETNDSEAPVQAGEAQDSNVNASQPAAETNTAAAPAASESKAADTNTSQAAATQSNNSSNSANQAAAKTTAQQKTTTAASTTNTSNSTSQYADLNARIAAAALAEVGTTDGQQCTEVATGALNAAGVDASVVWPAEYVQYGYYVSADQATAGNLIYYADGGAGYAHIAVYIGNGQAVQGNFDGKTVVAAADLSSYGTGASQAQYIQITG